MGGESGKVIVGDLGSRGGNFGEQSAFPDIGEPDEPDVGDDLHFEHQDVRLGSDPFLREIGGMAARGGKADVSLSASAAGEEKDFFAVLEGVADNLTRFKVAHEGAARDFDEDVLAAFPCALVGAAAFAVSREEF